MKAITRQPVWQLRCPHCRGKIRVEGSQYVVCCGQVYYLELAVHSESDIAWATQLVTQEQAIQALDAVPVAGQFVGIVERPPLVIEDEDAPCR